MLTELRIRNFAIIESLSLPLARGFNVLSGETGAGKSIIVASRLDETEALLAQVLPLRSETQVEDLVMGVMRKRFPLELASGEDA